MSVFEQKINEQKLNQFLERVVSDLAAGYGGERSQATTAHLVRNIFG